MLSQSATVPRSRKVSETPFYIPATGASTRPRRTLKHGDCFAVLDATPTSARRWADLTEFSFPTHGISRTWRCFSTATQPLLLGSSVRDDNSTLTVDLTNPDIYLDDKLVLPKDILHVVRTVFLWRDTAYQRLRIHNHGERPCEVRLTLAFASDFADLFEVRGMRRAHRGIASAEISGGTDVTLNYRGLDGKQRRTTLRFEPAPESLSTSVASHRFDLQPQRVPLGLRGGEMQRRPRRTTMAAVPKGSPWGVSRSVGAQAGEQRPLPPRIRSSTR